MTERLPPYVHLKHGAYYYVRYGSWHRLCGADADVFEALRIMPTPIPTSRRFAELARFVPSMVTRARNNSKGRRRIPWSLTQRDVYVMLNDCGWRCAVTGIRFSLEVINGKRPYAPSIDRIDSAGPYSPDNCRIVCVAANYAMNVWGEAVLHAMLNGRRSLSKKKTGLSKTVD